MQHLDARLLQLACDMVDAATDKVRRRMLKNQPSRGARQPVRALLAPKRRLGRDLGTPLVERGPNVTLTDALRTSLQEHVDRVAQAAPLPALVALTERAITAAAQHPHDAAFCLVRNAMLLHLSRCSPSAVLRRQRCKGVAVPVTGIASRGTAVTPWRRVTLEVRLIDGCTPLIETWEALKIEEVSQLARVALDGAFRFVAGARRVDVRTGAAQASWRAFLIGRRMIVVAAVGAGSKRDRTTLARPPRVALAQSRRRSPAGPE